MVEVRLPVDSQYDGWRLDHFIKARIPRLSRTRIQKMIRSQQRLGGRPLRPSARVAADQEVVLLRPAPVEPDVPRTFNVLYQDEQIVAIDKPAGLPVHATARFHRNTLTSVLREHFANEGSEEVPILAHRLDRETSGLILLGATKEAAIALKELFRRRQIEKRYLAIVFGEAPGQGVIDLPLGPDSASGIRVKMGVDSTGLPARTRYRSLQVRGGFTLLEAFPETGRQHQIRAHLAAVGHPVLGDKLYGHDPGCFLEFLETGWTESLEQRLVLPRQALHAADVTLPHPISKEKLHLSCPMPADLQAFWARVG